MSNPSHISKVPGSPPVPARRVHRLGEDRWRALIDAHGRSGLSVPLFCRERGVSASSFYKWRHRFADQGPASEGRFVRLEPSSSPSDRVEAVLPSGVVVRVPVSCLSQLIRLVYRDTPC